MTKFQLQIIDVAKIPINVAHSVIRNRSRTEDGRPQQNADPHEVSFRGGALVLNYRIRNVCQ